jgi:hypothetical protein
VLRNGGNSRQAHVRQRQADLKVGLYVHREPSTYIQKEKTRRRVPAGSDVLRVIGSTYLSGSLPICGPL